MAISNGSGPSRGDVERLARSRVEALCGLPLSPVVVFEVLSRHVWSLDASQGRSLWLSEARRFAKGLEDAERRRALDARRGPGSAFAHLLSVCREGVAAYSSSGSVTTHEDCRYEWRPASGRTVTAERGVEGEAVFNVAQTRRYWLQRSWDRAASPLVAVGLNPSTAGADDDDWTIKRLVKVARAWRYGGLVVVNAFPIISTEPPALWRADDEDDWNRLAVEYAVGRADIASAANAPAVLAFWGAGCPTWRVDLLLELVPHRARWRCLGVTSSGAPRHPRGIARTPLMAWDPVTGVASPLANLVPLGGRNA